MRNVLNYWYGNWYGNGNVQILVPEFGHRVCVHRVADIVIILIRWHDT